MNTVETNSVQYIFILIGRPAPGRRPTGHAVGCGRESVQHHLHGILCRTTRTSAYATGRRSVRGRFISHLHAVRSARVSLGCRRRRARVLCSIQVGHYYNSDAFGKHRVSSCGPGPIVWFVSAEVAPQNARSKICSSLEWCDEKGRALYFSA